jgi:hypothetical protein
MENSQVLERIADLERELISTKLQLACAMSSIDSLEHQLAITNTSLLRAKNRDNDNSNDAAAAPPFTLREASVVVPTANPLASLPSSKTGGGGYDTDSSSRGRPRKHMRKLNPSSCASGLNLFSEIKKAPRRLSMADGNPSRGGTGKDALPSLIRVPAHRPNPTSRGSVLDLSKDDFANSNPCASSRLNIFENLFEKGGASLLTPSTLSLSSSVVNDKRWSSHDIALLFGKSRPLSSSSLSGRRRFRSRTYLRGGSRSNVRLGHGSQGSNMCAEWDRHSMRNAEWDEF